MAPPRDSRQNTTLDRQLRRKIRAHVRGIGFTIDRNWKIQSPNDTKEVVRTLHSRQKEDRLLAAGDFLKANLDKTLPYFASGDEIQPDKIRPRLEIVQSGTLACSLFRVASLTWSVPVSQGYGRRMRFLVWDDHAEKLVGIIALGDPVFNLRVRDQFIGWTVRDRSQRLVNIMDAYVLGAIAPYSFMLGGKLVASLLRTREIRDYFSARYNSSRGVISHSRKRAGLVMITTTSSLGRSSVYNRVSLGGVQYLRSVGFTEGYGHFHVDGDLFQHIRHYLNAKRHRYARGYKFGMGPNWKFRAIRAALEIAGVDRNVLQHGLKREVFVCELAKNARGILRNEEVLPDYSDLRSVHEVSEIALDRWLRPRALRRPEFASWRRDDILKLLRVPQSK